MDRYESYANIESILTDHAELLELQIDQKTKQIQQDRSKQPGCFNDLANIVNHPNASSAMKAEAALVRNYAENETLRSNIPPEPWQKHYEAERDNVSIELTGKLKNAYVAAGLSEARALRAAAAFDSLVSSGLHQNERFRKAGDEPALFTNDQAAYAHVNAAFQQLRWQTPGIRSGQSENAQQIRTAEQVIIELEATYLVDHELYEYREDNDAFNSRQENIDIEIDTCQDTQSEKNSTVSDDFSAQSYLWEKKRLNSYPGAAAINALKQAYIKGGLKAQEAEAAAENFSKLAHLLAYNSIGLPQHETKMVINL